MSSIMCVLAVICFLVAAIFDSPPYNRALPLGLIFLTVGICFGHATL